ncbi:ABC transporter ATP-binding protein [Candidatus Bathyarchaeota archaeon]|nr:ABC transporter ATP-binding protein [Candidatus Bathyarchaeota archaeon]
MDIQLSIRGISKRWPNFELKSIDFEVNKGEYYALLGPTGSGKTLLLETILGFQHPDSGKVFVKGIDITEKPVEIREIGYVPQNSILFPHLTVMENIEFGPKMKGIKDNQMKDSVLKIIELLEINNFKNRMPSTLSGGEKQKVAIARAIATTPQILLLDEPLSNIDEETRQDLRIELKKVHKETGLTTIHVTHDKEEAYSLADKIAIINKGRIVQIGAPKEIYENPKDGEIARFLGYENIYNITSSANVREIKINGVNLIINEEIRNNCQVGIRAKDVIVNISSPKNLKNTLKGKITEKTFLGHSTLAMIEVGFNVTAILYNQKESNFEKGDEVYVTLPSTSIKVFSG